MPEVKSDFNHFAKPQSIFTYYTYTWIDEFLAHLKYFIAEGKKVQRIYGKQKDLCEDGLAEIGTVFHSGALHICIDRSYSLDIKTGFSRIHNFLFSEDIVTHISNL